MDTDPAAPPADELRRDEISAAVTPLGWRLLLGEVRTTVAVSSFTQAAALVAELGARGAERTATLDVHVGAGAVRLSVRPSRTQRVTTADLAVARAVSEVVTVLGLVTEPTGGAHPVAQTVELAVDALDIDAVRPFWRAVLDYVDAPPDPDAIVDPRGEGPAVWFQQMDSPRPQRNRIHWDVTVPHDEAEARLRATLAAGGRLLDDSEAPAFWVLADPEGNEACICTWQNRDDRRAPGDAQG